MKKLMGKIFREFFKKTLGLFKFSFPPDIPQRLSIMSFARDFNGILFYFPHLIVIIVIISSDKDQKINNKL
jgi:hypothetical protein